MRRSPLEYLRHILDETQFIMKRVEGFFDGSAGNFAAYGFYR